METNTSKVPDLPENNQADSPRSKKFNNPKMILTVGVAAFLVLAVCILGITIHHFVGQRQRGELLTSSTLEKIIEVSELSTYSAIYNGIVEVQDADDPEKVDYYVSYESKVKVGIDLAEVEETVDLEKGKIIVVLPELKITDVNVDFGSMDYIFVDKDAETETVAQGAYKACIADANSECENEMDIYLLAKKNAENIVMALINPLLKTMDHQYELEIRWEGQ